MKTPIEILLDKVEYKKIDGVEDERSTGLYATHIGVLKLGDYEIEVNILNDGQRVITNEGLKKIFGEKWEEDFIQITKNKGKTQQ